MDWTYIIETLGGSTSALVIVALIWDRLRLSNKLDALTDLLMQRKDDALRASVEREIVVQQSLEKIILLFNSGGAK